MRRVLWRRSYWRAQDDSSNTRGWYGIVGLEQSAAADSGIICFCIATDFLERQIVSSGHECRAPMAKVRQYYRLTFIITCSKMGSDSREKKMFRKWIVAGVTLFWVTSAPTMASSGTGASGADDVPTWLLVLFITGILVGVQEMVAGRHL